MIEMRRRPLVLEVEQSALRQRYRSDVENGVLFSYFCDEKSEAIRSVLQSGNHFRYRIAGVVAVPVGLLVNDEAVDTRERQTVNFNADCKDDREWRRANGRASVCVRVGYRGVG